MGRFWVVDAMGPAPARLAVVFLFLNCHVRYEASVYSPFPPDYPFSLCFPPFLPSEVIPQKALRDVYRTRPSSPRLTVGPRQLASTTVSRERDNTEIYIALPFYSSHLISFPTPGLLTCVFFRCPLPSFRFQPPDAALFTPSGNAVVDVDLEPPIRVCGSLSSSTRGLALNVWWRVEFECALCIAHYVVAPFFP